jgi:hypothetical protein
MNPNDHSSSNTQFCQILIITIAPHENVEMRLD